MAPFFDREVGVHPFLLFLSSPGDCAEERQAVHDVAARLNSDPLVSAFAHIEVVAWDQGHGIPLELLASPQTSVDNHLPTPESCDVFIGVFNCRLGTPLPIQDFRKFDGSSYLSGTEYEFHRAWEQRRRGAYLPEMLIYRKQHDSKDCADKEQFDRLEAFFGHPPFKDGMQWIGSVDRYQSPAEFTNKLEAHLRKLLGQRQPGSSPPFYAWLRRQAELIKANAGPRYSADAHVEFGQRVRRKLASLIRVHRDQTVAMVVHGGVIEAAFTYFVGVDRSHFEGSYPAAGQTSLTLWRECPQRGQWVQEYANDTQHLKVC